MVGGCGSSQDRFCAWAFIVRRAQGIGLYRSQWGHGKEQSSSSGRFEAAFKQKENEGRKIRSSACDWIESQGHSRVGLRPEIQPGSR